MNLNKFHFFLNKFQSIKYNKYYQTCNVCVQWPQAWKWSIFIPISKEGDAKECSNYHTIELISHVSKIMLKILHASLQ